MNLINHLIEFAERVDKIEAITQGHDPADKKFAVYYFVYSEFDPQLKDVVHEFDSYMHAEHCCTIDSYHHGIDRIPHQSHLGEVIWKREAI